MTVRFDIRVRADPQSLGRILGHFSQAWITPTSFESHVLNGEIQCRCTIDHMELASAKRIAHKLESSVLVIAAMVRLTADG